MWGTLQSHFMTTIYFTVYQNTNMNNKYLVSVEAFTSIDPLTVALVKKENMTPDNILVII